MANDTKLAKSINYKTLAGLGDKDEQELMQGMKDLAKEDTVIAKIAGEITGYTKKTGGKFGDSYAFNGVFIAQSAITGEIFETTKMFFDKGFTEALISQFDGRSESNEMVKFSAQIAVVKYHKSPGFTYMATPLRTPEAITRRAELLGVLQSAPLLAAPKTAKK